MKTLILTKGYETIVDDDDYEHLFIYKWSAIVIGRKTKNVYAYRRKLWDVEGRKWRGMISLHRSIMCPPDDMDVDHIDNDTLNNQKSNLRIATRSQNSANNRHAIGVSGFRGVVLTRHGEKAPYGVMCRGKYLGTFFDKIEAARAYDAAAIKEFGEFAKLNFPMVPSQT